MPITYVSGIQTAGTNGQSNYSASLPPGNVANDILILSCRHTSSTAIVAPSGWTRYVAAQGDANQLYMSVFTKTSTGAEPSTVTLSNPSLGEMEAGSIAIRGADTAVAPIVANSINSTPANSFIDAALFTATGPGMQVALMRSREGGTHTFTNATERLSAVGYTVGFATATITGAGSSAPAPRLTYAAANYSQASVLGFVEPAPAPTPTITVPAADGFVVRADTQTVTWTTSGTQAQYQVRVTDSGDTTTYYDTGEVTSATQSISVPFPTDGVARTIRVRWKTSTSEWSAYALRTVTVTHPTIKFVKTHAKSEITTTGSVMTSSILGQDYLVKEHTPDRVLGSGSTIAPAIATPGTSAIGNLLILWAAFDSLALTTPIVSTIVKPAGETNNWVKLASFDSATAGANSGVRGEIWAIKTTVIWPPASNTVTLSGAVVNKLAQIREYSNVSINVRAGTLATFTSINNAANNVDTPSPPQLGDLVIGASALEYGGYEPSSTVRDTDTTNGTWYPSFPLETTSTQSVSGLSSIFQHKIVTATGVQSYLANWGTAVDGGNIILALIPETVSPGVAKDNLLVAYASYDNLTATTPVVSSLDVPAGETASWTIANLESATATAAQGVCHSLMWIKTTVEWPVATVVTATLSGSVGDKAMVLQEFSGTVDQPKGVSTGNIQDTGISDTVSASAAPQPVAVGDLVIIGGGFEQGGETGSISVTPATWLQKAEAYSLVSVGTSGVSCALVHRIAADSTDFTANFSTTSAPTPNAGAFGRVFAAAGGVFAAFGIPL